MIALWYTAGRLERAPFQDGRARIQRMKPTCPIAMILDPFPMASLFAHTWVEEAHRLAKGVETPPPVWVPWTRHARRLLAREHGGPGRRRARAVARGRWVQPPPRPRVEALLYLPAGESVTQMHLDDVAMWLERNPA